MHNDPWVIAGVLVFTIVAAHVVLVARSAGRASKRAIDHSDAEASEAPTLEEGSRRRLLDALMKWSGERGFVATGWTSTAMSAGYVVHAFHAHSPDRRINAMIWVGSSEQYPDRPFGPSLDLKTNFNGRPQLRTSNGGISGTFARIDELDLPYCIDPDALLAVHTARLDRTPRVEVLLAPTTLPELILEQNAIVRSWYDDATRYTHRNGRVYYRWRYCASEALKMSPLLKSITLSARAKRSIGALVELGLKEHWHRPWQLDPDDPDSPWFGR